MGRATAALLLAPLLLPQDAAAQAAATGHRLFIQNCAVCHLKPLPAANRYGPELSHETVQGKEAAIRDLIQKGTPNMPGFRDALSPRQIEAIIAYLDTVAPSPAPAK